MSHSLATASRTPQLDRTGNISLIDWEYAGMSNMAADFGTMTVCWQR